MRSAITIPDLKLVPLSVLFLVALTISACGLALDDDDRMVRAQAAFEEQEYVAAIIDLKTVIQNSPENAQARMMLGLAQAADGDLVSAASQFQKAFDLGQPLADYRVPFAEALLATGQPERVLEIADPIAAINDAEAFELFLLRGDALLESGAIVGALRSFAQAKELNIDNASAFLRSAEVYWGQGNLRDAREFADRAVADDSANIDAQLTLGAILLDMSESRRAENVFRNGLSTLQLNAEERGYFLSYLAEAHLAQGDLSAARTAAEQVAELWAADDPDLRILDGMIAFADGDYDTAATELQAYLVAFPESARALRSLGQAQLELGLVHTARKNIVRSLAMEPDQRDALASLARAHLLEGQTELARETLEQALESGVRKPELLGLFSIIDTPAESQELFLSFGGRLTAGDADDLVSKAQTLVGERPDDAAAYDLLGTSQLLNGLPEAAVQSFTKATQLDSSNSRLRRNLALAYLGAAEPEMGLDTVREIRMVKDADDVDALRRALIVDFLQAGKFSDQPVATASSHWLEDNPEDFGVRMLLAEAYAGLGQFEEAANEYEILLRQEWEDPAIHNNLAWAYLQLGDQRAREQAEAAHKLAPDNAAIQDTLGWILVGEGRLREGLTLLSDAHLLLPGDASIAYHFAFTLAQMGEEADAKAVLGQIIDRDDGPVAGEAAALLRELNSSP